MRRLSVLLQSRRGRSLIALCCIALMLVATNILAARYLPERLDLTAALAATAALCLSFAQRFLSTPARALRRRVAHVDGSITLHDGTVQELDEPTLLEPLERALSSMSWGMLALALALIADRVL